MAKPEQATRAKIIEAFSRLPLSFELNRGQTDKQVRYLARARGYTVFLTGNETVLALLAGKSKVERQGSKDPNREALPQSLTSGSTPAASGVVRMTLVGANPAPRMAGMEELPGKSNYFIGRDPQNWHTEIPNYRKVAVRQVYPGVDLIYYGNQRQLEYDFTLAPGVDPRAITLDIETGNSKLETRPAALSVDSNGDLVIAMEGGELRFHKPVAYQEQLTGGRQPSTVSGPPSPPTPAHLQSTIAHRHYLEGRYVLRPSNPKSKIENPKFEVGFEIAAYDPSQPLVIDPVLSYSTYLGGSQLETGKGIAVDNTGNAYVVGETDSLNFPTAHALQPNAGGPRDFPDDAFVAKISADGSTLLYSTYLGGRQQDIANGIAVDTFGSAYVTGTTLSEDFPATPGSFDANCGQDGHCNSTIFNGLITSDAFVTKLNPAGSAIVYSTFYGVLGNEQGFGIAVDTDGNAYLTGSTDATLYPSTAGTFQGVRDAFVAKFSPTGSSVLYDTHLGGSGEDQGFGIAADSSGNAYVTGLTFSTNFPMAGTPFQNIFQGAGDAFVTKIDTNAGVFLYSTYLGGSGRDQGNGIAVDTTGKAYVAGVTDSTDFPASSGALQTSCALNTLGVCTGDAFVAKLDPTQAGVLSRVYATYLGGTGADSGAGIALDSSGNAYVIGFTNSSDFPTSPGIFQPTYGGANDAFVAELNTDGSASLYASYLGGSNAESGNSIAVDIGGNAYLTGQTCSTDFPTVTPLQASPGGNCDAFVAKVALAAGPGIGITPSPVTFTAQAVGTTSAPQTVTVVSNGTAALTITNIATSGDFAQTNTCVGAGPLAIGSTCTINVTFTPTATGAITGTLTITDNAFNSPQVANLTGTGTAPAVSLNPTSLAFGNQLVGTTSSSQTVTLTNTGNAASLTIFGIDASGDFVQNNTCGNSLAVNATCTINVTFVPAATGIRNGAITITDNALNSPQVVSLTGHGTAPLVTLSPSNLAFGNQGATGPAQTVTLSNIGDGALNITSIAISENFAQTNTCGASVAPGTSCTFTVTFVPTTPGPVTGQLTISDNAATSPQVVSLSGNATIPVVSLNPTGLTFGNQPVNTTSAPQTVVVMNTGNATVNITSIQVTGSNSGDFSLNQNCGSAIAVGASCTIIVAFTPTGAGTRLGAVTITDNAVGSPQTIALTGTGILLPSVTLSATSLTFGDQSVGTTSAAQNVTLTNSGGGPLNLTGITASGDFAQTNTCGASVAAGASCIISITFRPTDLGNRFGSVTITDNATDSPQTILLAGNGTAVGAVTLSPTSLTFAGQPLGTTSAVQAVTLTNSGSATLNITSLVASGDFAQINTCGPSLPQRASCTISVTFTPTATGTRSGAITITDNAPTSPQIVTLGGSGADFSIAAAPATTAIFAGDTATYTVTITPAFGFNAKVSLSCSGVPRGATCTASPTSVTLVGTNPSTATVSVATAVRTMSPPGSGPDIPLPRTGLRWYPWALVLILLVSMAVASRRRRAALALGVTLFLLLLWTACAGGGVVGVPRGTPAGNYVLTLTGASGNATHTTTVNLTVN